MSDQTTSNGPAVSAVNVSKRYGRTEAVKELTLEVARGEFAVLTGPSGSGKSTLLNLVAALESPDSGTIEVGGHRLWPHPRHLSQYRRAEVGMIFQLHNLIPRLTARENVEAAMFGTHLHRRARMERSEELLVRLDLVDRMNEKPPTLSGGERQRVAIARALANRPPLILADEPTGSLDDASSDLVLDLFAELLKGGVTVLAVSHDQRLNARADRLIPIVGGAAVGA